jgi:hypothetical protein
MTVTIEHRAPQVRCYECGSSAVRAFCHHCWRPGCSRHVVTTPDWTQRLFGAEGSGPGLKKVRAAHCADHTQTPAGIWLVAGTCGLALAVAGLFATLVTYIVGAALLVAGAATVFVVYAQVRRATVLSRATLPLALHPKVSEVRSLERLKARITLDAHGNYQTRVNPVQGRLSAVATFAGPDRERVRDYLRKHRLTTGQKVRYSAGFLVPQGPVAIRELAGNRGVDVGGNDAAAIVGIDRENAPAACRCDITLNYTLSADPDIKAGPFWITPSIAPESERHTLEIDIQWTEFGPDEGDPIELDVIELLRVRVPVGWGRVKEISRGPATVSPGTEGEGSEWFRDIEWKQLSPSRLERQGRQFTIAVQFENPIADEDDLSGRLEATMKGSLSGVNGIRLYNALGTSRGMSGPPSVKTQVEADFTLSMASVRYQALRVVPDREDEDADHHGFPADFDAIPDDETLISLTNALAEAQFYVKRVTENPPRTGGRADVMHRFWNIAGRSYIGVHPVDFHLVITGEEVHKGDVRPEAGSMNVGLSVSGAYTDAVMRDRVDGTLTRLREVVGEAVLKARRSTGHGPTIN